MPRRKRPVLHSKPTALEQFEGRALLSTVPLGGQPGALASAYFIGPRSLDEIWGEAPMHPDLQVAADVAPDAGGGPPSSALTPAQARHIYGFDQITNLGAGQTIAIVDAYDDPNIAADADAFDKQFMTTLGGSTSLYTAYGASSTWLTKDYAQGSKPASNGGWAQEISLDVEWAHAIAPQAKIVLVEAASNSYANLLGGDTYAANTVHASVVSNSWGGGESRARRRLRQHVRGTRRRHLRLLLGRRRRRRSTRPSRPTWSPSAGRRLTHDSSYNWTGETAWSGSGGGLSAYEASPSYQSGLGYSKRAAPDVAYDADPNTGFAVYDSLRYRASRAGSSSAAPAPAPRRSRR